jgi:hypothetical protein
MLDRRHGDPHGHETWAAAGADQLVTSSGDQSHIPPNAALAASRAELCARVTAHARLARDPWGTLSTTTERLIRLPWRSARGARTDTLERCAASTRRPPIDYI